MLITHDLGLVAEYADRVAVMYAGRIVETGPAAALFARPRHPYTVGLLAARPRLHGPREALAAIPGAVASPRARPPGCPFQPRCPRRLERCAADAAAGRCRRAPGRLLEPGVSDEPFLAVDRVSKEYPLKGGGTLHAVRGVSFRQRRGETLGVVGESGCGKSTLGQADPAPRPADLGRGPGRR